MRNLLGLVIATGLWLGWAATSQAQVAVSVNPYSGVSVATPYSYFGARAYVPAPVYAVPYTPPAAYYRPGYYAYPGAGYYSSGYAAPGNVSVSVPGFYYSGGPTYGGYYGGGYYGGQVVAPGVNIRW